MYPRHIVTCYFLACGNCVLLTGAVILVTKSIRCFINYCEMIFKNFGEEELTAVGFQKENILENDFFVHVKRNTKFNVFLAQ